MAKKKRSSNVIGWLILAVMAVGIFHFGNAGTGNEHRSATASKPTQSSSAVQSNSEVVSLTQPRFVNVASLNVRHTPSISGELIMALPRGTALKVLDRQGEWLLIDINPTLEGWVAEQLTTTQVSHRGYLPPVSLTGAR